MATTQQRDEQSSPVTLLRILRRRWLVILACALVLPGAALAFSLSQEKQYSTSASLLFRDPQFDQKLFGSTVFAPTVDAAREAATNVKLVSLNVVGDRTARQLHAGLTGPDVMNHITVASEGQSDVASITATHPVPAFAARLANTFAQQYIAFRRDADRSKIQAAQQLVQRQINQLPAAEQNGPSHPQPLRNTMFGFVLGLLLGIALAVAIERFDRRLKDPKEISDSFDRPVLGAIPESRTIGKSQQATLDLGASEAEAFRMLRANLRYFNVDRQVISVLITSASPAEGKSTVAVHLAAAAASAGQNVLLLEADLRRPTLTAKLGMSAGVGLSQVLSGDFTLQAAVQTVPVANSSNEGGLRTMDVCVAGPIPPNPSDLIESERMRKIIKRAEGEYDLVVVDTPPTSVVSDAIPLVNEVSGVIVVTRLGKTTRESASHLRNQLENLDAYTLGVVVNSVGKTGRYGYGYGGYGYGYQAANAPAAANGAAPTTTRKKRAERNGHATSPDAGARVTSQVLAPPLESAGEPAVGGPPPVEEISDDGFTAPAREVSYGEDYLEEHEPSEASSLRERLRRRQR
jgi:capsular exopolysaccharide synthesis family protein